MDGRIVLAQLRDLEITKLPFMKEKDLLWSVLEYQGFHQEDPRENELIITRRKCRCQRNNSKPFTDGMQQNSQ